MFDKLCPKCREKMPYAVMCRTGSLEWTYFRSRVLGKDAAYQIVKNEKANHPNTEWRVLPKNVADALIYGMKLGKEIAEQQTNGPPARQQRRPLMYMPDNV